jgi:hypothetical protein
MTDQSPERIPVEVAVGMLLWTARPQQLPPAVVAKLLEDAWCEGRLRIWRDGRRMRRHEMMAYYVHIDIDADDGEWVCSIEQRHGTGISVPWGHIKYTKDGSVMVTKRPRWELSRENVEDIPVPIQDAPEPAAQEAPAPPTAVDPKPAKRKGGNRRGAVWDEVILPGLAAKVKTNGGPFIDEQAVVAAARVCLAADPKKRKLSPDALVKGTRQWCLPEWIVTNKPAPGN